MGVQFSFNKTGTRQYTWAVWSAFDEIHSRYPLRFIDALFWVAGILEFVMPYNHNTHETYPIYPMSMIAISSLDFLWLACSYIRLRDGLLNMTKYLSSTGIIRNFGRLRAIRFVKRY